MQGASLNQLVLDVSRPDDARTEVHGDADGPILLAAFDGTAEEAAEKVEEKQIPRSSLRQAQGRLWPRKRGCGQLGMTKVKGLAARLKPQMGGLQIEKRGITSLR